MVTQLGRSISWFLHKLPNQDAEDNAGDSGDEKRPTPSETRGDLSGQHRSQRQPNERPCTNNDSDVASATLRLGSSFNHGSHGRPSRTLSDSQQSSNEEQLGEGPCDPRKPGKNGEQKYGWD